MRQDEILIEDEAVGIVAPCYAVEMPMMVKEFIERAKIKTKYFFFIYTYGMGFAEAHKKQVHETQFPKDLEKAFDLGKRLAVLKLD